MIVLGAEDISQLGLWGNYTIPKDNPYIEDKELQPEIWALGMRNPWRCSFDSARPSYFMCADVGQVMCDNLTLQEVLIGHVCLTANICSLILMCPPSNSTFYAKTPYIPSLQKFI